MEANTKELVNNVTDGNALNSQAKRLDVSWEIIEHEYRKGEKSIREIGREHNISDTAIRQKAQKLGWEREKDQATNLERHLNDPTKGENGLTPKQTILVEEYLKDPVASKAGEKAGMTAHYAQELLRTNANVALAIGKGQQKRAEKAGLDADYILERLIQVVERCLQHEAVLLHDGSRLMIETPDGEIAAAFTFQSAGANRALELLGKYMKLFGDKVEHEHTHDHHFHVIPAQEVRDEIEEWFSVPALLPPPRATTKH